MSRGRQISRCRGFSLTELLVVASLVTVSVAVALPRLDEFYAKHRLNSAATEFQSMILRARMSALKEKASYRLVLHDEDATSANRYELQKNQSGSWVSVDGGAHDIASAVAILGSGSTDSVDNVTVSGRGVCSTGVLYLRSERGRILVVKVDATCYSEVS